MDEELKQPLLIAVLSFNIVFVAYQFLFNWFPNFTMFGAFIGALIGAVVGGGLFAAMYFLGRQ